ncbi:hypothetical protein QQS21_011418 [Conoideocrella luteorostrata]|uniref:DUF7728 domain-containing protein n=1 Tax=Conoideocrella luteorostrata TaxID=1105319 RepID=A0AAJ0FTC8_9HYPO|nr:hypothetical protein QQS21_011418 [Conoideocrella luteorostrata]
MLLQPLAFAVAAAAFVIVPELSEADENAFKALPIHDTASSQPIPDDSHLVSLPCKQCDGRDSSLKLNFSVVDDVRLLVNGFEVYPNADPWHGDLAASVQSAGNESPKQKLGYSLAIGHAPAMGWHSHLELLNVQLRIIEVGERFVDGVPAVNVQLLKAPTNEIVVTGIDTTMNKDSSGCKSMMCQAKNAMADAFRSLKGFRPFKGCHRRPHHGQDKSPQSSGSKRPQPSDSLFSDQVAGAPSKHRRPPHNFRHRHEWGRLLTNIVAQVFLPVLMGITAGVGVALFAMAVCSLFFRLTALARGKRENGLSFCPCSRKQTIRIADEEATASEKAGLMGDDEVPPHYEDYKN